MRNMAMQPWKFEMDEENQEADAVMSPQRWHNQSTSTKRDGLDTISFLEAGEEIQEILRRGQTAKGM